MQELCHGRGAKLILDEVQTGLGRTGAMWCYQHQHDRLQPDVVVTGKGLSGGVYPITATLMTRELHAVFDRRPFVHISTFGGSEGTEKQADHTRYVAGCSSQGRRR